MEKEACSQYRLTSLSSSLEIPSDPWRLLVGSEDLWIYVVGLASVVIVVTIAFLVVLQIRKANKRSREAKALPHVVDINNGDGYAPIPTEEQ